VLYDNLNIPAFVKFEMETELINNPPKDGATLGNEHIIESLITQERKSKSAINNQV
jgi:hypothetical protein